MKVSFFMVPRYHVSITSDDLLPLMTLSEHHYDGACKAASRPGGFLHRWNAILEHRAEGDDPDSELLLLPADRRELDTLLKICEGVRMAVSCRMLTQDQCDLVDKLCSLVLTVLEESTLKASALPEHEYTEPTKRGRLAWATAPGRF